jgi:hypothetical protein
VRQGLSRLCLALVLVAFCLPLFFGLGFTDLANDEAIYSYAVDSIVRTGAWMAPLSSPNHDIVFLEKPHLKFWIVAAPIRAGLLPANEFGMRLWDAVFGGAAFVYVFLIGRRLAGPVCGFGALLILFGHWPLLFDHGLRSNNMDAAQVLAYCGGVYHYLRWADASTARLRNVHIGAIAAFFYLGFMTKFVAAVFLPLILGVCALLSGPGRRRVLEDRRRWLVAAGLVIVAIVPWFVYQHVQHGTMLWRVMFGDHVYTRFTAYADPNHLHPWHYYISEGYRHLVRSGSAIWVGLGLVLMIVRTARERLPERVLILVWAILPLALISTGTSKLYHYAYPYLPPFALMGGYAGAWVVRSLVDLAGRWTFVFSKPERESAAWLRRAAAIVLVLALTLALYSAYFGPVRLELGGLSVFRNTSVLRPLTLAIICGGLLAGPRAALAAALIVVASSLVPTPLSGYASNLERLTVHRRPLGLLAECLRSVDSLRRERGEPTPGVYAPVSETAFLHPYFYYLRGVGWQAKEADHDLLQSALFDPGQERPVILDKSRYARFLETAGENARPVKALDFPNVVVLLPGDYAGCYSTRQSEKR